MLQYSHVFIHPSVITAGNNSTTKTPLLLTAAPLEATSTALVAIVDASHPSNSGYPASKTSDSGSAVALQAAEVAARLAHRRAVALQLEVSSFICARLLVLSLTKSLDM